ncbi:MAG: nucleotidyltransferase family protein [Lachnospiraceae bacterium]|nr:nucleotidyltransferase family protein [Lachnospiraceae bacterium]
MKTGAVIVAAGLSSRMGDFKPLMAYGGTTIARHVVRLVRNSGADPVVMVTGYRAEELEAHLADTGILFVRNEQYGDTQMFDSVKLGISAVVSACDRILLLPVDTPGICEKTFQQVLAIDSDMVRTMYGGRPGHPILLRSCIAEELCSYEGEGGLRGAMEHSGFLITDLYVDDRGVNWDVDTQDEYRELIRWKEDRI